MINNLSLHPFCQGFYRYELGALSEDSSGKGNDLQVSGTPLSTDNNIFEGSHSILLFSALSQYLFQTNGNLADGFPLKSNDSKKQITFGTNWCIVLGATIAFMSKGVAGDECIIFYYDFADKKHKVSIGYGDGSTQEEVATVGTLNVIVNKNFYSFFTFDDAKKQVRVVVYDQLVDAGGSPFHVKPVIDEVLIFTNNIHLNTEDFYIAANMGAVDMPFGYYDGSCIFNTILSEHDMSQIVRNRYPRDVGAPMLL